jgi:hypothetical protein
MSANRWPGISDQAAAQIEAALARGHKIEAIKIYRQETNCGLKEAKDAIEAGEAGTAPAGGKDWRRDVASGSPKRAGPNWLTMVLVLIVVGVVLAALLLALR